MRTAALFVLSMACGGRTELGELLDEVDQDGGIADARMDHHTDGRAPDGSITGPDSGACDDFTDDLTPTATMDLGTACDEGENTSSPPSMSCGTVGVAWEWVPDKNMAVSRIEIWTEGASQVAFYGDDNARPGTLLFQGGTGGAPGDPPTWRGADVTPPISVRACHRYYVRQILPNGGGPCSWSSSGVYVREYTVNNNGGWDGPFPGMWMARLRGACN